MHSYLKTIGFSSLSKAELNEILEEVVKNYDEKYVAESHPEHLYAEFSKNYGCDCGITVCGEYDEENQFHMEYYYPFFRGTGITTQESVIVEKHADKESYAGACDDLRIGVTMIFYLQNCTEYVSEMQKNNFDQNHMPLTLSGLAKEGKILLPVKKDQKQVAKEKELAKNRSTLIAAARNGDEAAMENLTMDDIDTYSMISRRIVKEDVFTIVDSYFMPYGIECDKYNVMGEIIDCVDFRNILTGEKIYQMTIECNDMQFDICINESDLLGEPKVGRRFKGIIWLQGQIQFCLSLIHI